ncbi:argininosuccinate lyase [Helicobacter zhangjianzhongii]|uniref:argininosuccinate lyase n=1 Tax=Helicobacter zhangjianzhongii TaxID=2974574 RepID=UPI0025553889|nr:argininosuccinate lyase [Helicobacter sp. CPD2-1]MDL0079779.1 argininosuccinate lyase [Helicobacter sp. CPD2-1]
MAKLWGGRFELDSSALLDVFNASITFDKKLWRYDILGSKTHARMLGRIGVLDSSEVALIESGLEKIASEIEQGSFRFSLEQEDIHMAIESALIEHIGDVGKKLHTARSRNDQVALDCRMYVLDHSVLIANKLLTLIQALLAIARKHTHTLMPGMTHLQHAQPINLGFHLVAWCESLRRDVERLESLHKRNNLMPLGSGALAGTPYNNDREWVSKQLGFAAPTLNAMDSVSDRDFALDLLYALAMLGMHISRIAEELVLWSSAEFGFMRLSDAYSTGSSIMPQKKNPDVPELLRGKSGRLYGNLVRLLVVMKSLPLAYNKDTQEDKEAIFDSVESALISLEILQAVCESASFDKKAMLKACQRGHLSATDLADFLVRECGVPFREAHHITGRIVAYAESQGCDLSELSGSELARELSKLAPKLESLFAKSGVAARLTLLASMQARTSLGGTASKATSKQIAALNAWVKKARKRLPKLKIEAKVENE